jgi:hypothetical protein
MENCFQFIICKTEGEGRMRESRGELNMFSICIDIFLNTEDCE